MNFGRITGGDNGVGLGFGGATSDVFINHGAIVGGSRNLPGRFGSGVIIEGNATRLVNLGTIDGIGTTSNGVTIGQAAGGEGSRVDNFGTITSLFAAGIDFSGLGNGGGQTAAVRNFGLIEGVTSGVLGNDPFDTLVNRGTIIGGVSLGIGNDTYDGIGGVVEGTIAGGAGNDIVAGNSGIDTIRGADGDA